MFDGDLVLQLPFRKRKYCHNFRHLGIVGQLFVVVLVHVNKPACISSVLDDPFVAFILIPLTRTKWSLGYPRSAFLSKTGQRSKTALCCVAPMRCPNFIIFGIVAFHLVRPIVHRLIRRWKGLNRLIHKRGRVHPFDIQTPSFVALRSFRLILGTGGAT